MVTAVMGASPISNNIDAAVVGSNPTYGTPKHIQKHQKH